MALFTGANFNDRIIDEIPGLLWKHAFETSKADIDENIPPLGTTEFDDAISNIQLLARKALLPLYERYGAKFDGSWINSWYRNENVNRLAGGVPTSNHRTGLAADVKYPVNIASREENENIFYFLYGYFRKNNIQFDELIWEAKDSDFIASGKALKFPQLIHIGFKASGGRRYVGSIGVNKDFSQDKIDDGHTNSGATELSKIQKGEILSAFVFANSALPPFGRLAGQDFRAKFILIAATLIDLLGTQMDYVSSKNRVSDFEGGIMKWRGERLSQFITAGNPQLGQSYLNMLRGGNTQEIDAKRNDTSYLESLSSALRTRQSVNAQLKEMGNSILGTFDRIQALSLREPLCYAFAAELYSSDKNSINLLGGKSDLLGMTTDGSWLDYYTKNNSDTQISTRYANYIKQFMEK